MVDESTMGLINFPQSGKLAANALEGFNKIKTWCIFQIDTCVDRFRKLEEHFLVSD
jgi:hypothetical protein